MFQGRYSYSVDVKGRVSIPSDFRSILQERYASEELFVTIFKDSGERILLAYPRTDWQHLVEKLSATSQFESKLNDFRRVFVSGATLCVPDKQGRISLTAEQRRYAAIEKEVTFVGAGSRRIELWDRSTWERWHQAKEDTTFEGVGSVLKEVGL